MIIKKWNYTMIQIKNMNMKKYIEFIKEKKELVEETRNTALVGDWIIRAKTDAGEEYVLKSKKFPMIYNIDSAKVPEDSKIAELGYMEYDVIPEERDAIICSRGVMEIIKSKISDLIETTVDPEISNTIKKCVPQKDMYNIIKSDEIQEKLIKVSKKSSAYARQAKTDEEVITKVEKGNDPEFYFEPSWTGSMPVAEDDILVINSSEVYRIARSEFNQTYNQPTII